MVNMKTQMIFSFLLFWNIVSNAQNNLNVLYYLSVSPTIARPTSLDSSVLNDTFDTVTVNGSVTTSDVTFGFPFSSLPTSVSGFSGIDLVVMQHSNFISSSISLSQANALIDFVKGGGVLFAGLEGAMIPGTGSALEYIGERLFCPSEGVNLSLKRIFSGLAPSPAYHPGDGTLLLTGGSAGDAFSTRSYDSVSGVPSESAILIAENLVSTNPCIATGVLEFIVPSYPGNSSCGVNGFSILGGEQWVGLAGTFFSGSSSTIIRNETVLNQNYAQLIYDFLYDPVAMGTRLTWASDPANTNATCAPMALSCSITDPGTVAGVCVSPSNNLEFSLNLTGINTGATYSVSGAIPATGTYGTPTMFTIASGSDGTDKIITITDDTDTSCTLDVTITGVTACFICDSGADGPKFLGLTKSTWVTIGIVSVVGAFGGLLLKKFVF